jgi:hypothetical protein
MADFFAFGAARQKHISALIGALATGCKAYGLYLNKLWFTVAFDTIYRWVKGRF